MNNTKTAWIIGASSGIGKALAELLARNNWRVAISSRSAERLNAIAENDPNIFAYPLDLTDKESIELAKNGILKDLGSIDTLFLNAGDYTPMPLDEFDPDLFDNLMAINFHGTVNGLNTLLPYMKERKSGEIYITGSLAGYRGLPKAAPYNASKAAVMSLAESLHLELKQHGITLRLISPGFVESPLTNKNDFDMPFIISPEKAADYIYKELNTSNFEIRFPKRFAWIMNTLRIVPYKVYFWLTKASAKPAEKETNNESTNELKK